MEQRKDSAAQRKSTFSSQSNSNSNSNSGGGGANARSGDTLWRTLQQEARKSRSFDTRKGSLPFVTICDDTGKRKHGTSAFSSNNSNGNGNKQQRQAADEEDGGSRGPLRSYMEGKNCLCSNIIKDANVVFGNDDTVSIIMKRYFIFCNNKPRTMDSFWEVDTLLRQLGIVAPLPLLHILLSNLLNMDFSVAENEKGVVDGTNENENADSVTAAVPTQLRLSAEVNPLVYDHVVATMETLLCKARRKVYGHVSCENFVLLCAELKHRAEMQDSIDAREQDDVMRAATATTTAAGGGERTATSRGNAHISPFLTPVAPYLPLEDAFEMLTELRQAKLERRKRQIERTAPEAEAEGKEKEQEQGSKSAEEHQRVVVIDAETINNKNMKESSIHYNTRRRRTLLPPTLPEEEEQQQPPGENSNKHSSGKGGGGGEKTRRHERNYFQDESSSSDEEEGAEKTKGTSDVQQRGATKCVVSERDIDKFVRVVTEGDSTEEDLNFSQTITKSMASSSRSLNDSVNANNDGSGSAFRGFPTSGSGAERMSPTQWKRLTQAEFVAKYLQSSSKGELAAPDDDFGLTPFVHHPEGDATKQQGAASNAHADTGSNNFHVGAKKKRSVLIVPSMKKKSVLSSFIKASVVNAAAGDGEGGASGGDDDGSGEDVELDNVSVTSSEEGGDDDVTSSVHHTSTRGSHSRSHSHSHSRSSQQHQRPDKGKISLVPGGPSKLRQQQHGKSNAAVDEEKKKKRTTQQQQQQQRQSFQHQALRDADAISIERRSSKTSHSQTTSKYDQRHKKQSYEVCSLHYDEFQFYPKLHRRPEDTPAFYRNSFMPPYLHQPQRQHPEQQQEQQQHQSSPGQLKEGEASSSDYHSFLREHTTTYTAPAPLRTPRWARKLYADGVAHREKMSSFRERCSSILGRRSNSSNNNNRSSGSITRPDSAPNRQRMMTRLLTQGSGSLVLDSPVSDDHITHVRSAKKSPPPTASSPHPNKQHQEASSPHPKKKGQSGNINFLYKQTTHPAAYVGANSPVRGTYGDRSKYDTDTSMIVSESGAAVAGVGGIRALHRPQLNLYHHRGATASSSSSAFQQVKRAIDEATTELNDQGI